MHPVGNIQKNDPENQERNSEDPCPDPLNERCVGRSPPQKLVHAPAISESVRPNGIALFGLDIFDELLPLEFRAFGHFLSSMDLPFD
jgi:hypothetical protein